jgi:acetyl/propionyl-CoA carboxylase alpha subunit
MSKLAVNVADNVYEVDVEMPLQIGGEWRVTVNGRPVQVELPASDRPFAEIEWVIVDGRPLEIVFDHDLRWLRTFRGMHHIEVRDLEALTSRPVGGDGRVKAPIPGLIARVLVEVGQRVTAGDAVVVLEAMKMENEIAATNSGHVTAIHVAAGQSVLRQDVLVEIR